MGDEIEPKGEKKSGKGHRASIFSSFFLLVCLWGCKSWRDDFVHGGSFWFVVIVCNECLLLLFTEIMILLLLGSFGVILVESVEAQQRWRGRRCNEEGKGKNKGRERKRHKKLVCQNFGDNLFLPCQPHTQQNLEWQIGPTTPRRINHLG